LYWSPPMGTKKLHSLGRVTSMVPSWSTYDFTPRGRRPRGKLFCSRMSYAVAAVEDTVALLGVEEAAWRIHHDQGSICIASQYKICYYHFSC
jgi:hypothetical protein